MASKASLSCQSKHLCIVIRKCKKYNIETIKKYCEENFTKYAFIVHEGDISALTGEVETIHYHIVGDAIGKGVSFHTRLNTLISYLNEDDAIGIEIDQYRSLQNSIQYLTHKNQREKSQHDVKEIIHNFNNREFEILYNANVGDCITFDLLYSICDNCTTIIEVMKEIGSINNYLHYRNVIWDIWKALKGDKDYVK